MLGSSRKGLIGSREAALAAPLAALWLVEGSEGCRDRNF